jgi:CubicO group peptidase (beta-lactamase class C family)
MMIAARMLVVVMMILVFVATAGAQGLPRAKNAEEVGLSSDRLKRITAGFKNDVDKGAIPGAVILVARKGKVAYYETIGFQDRENKIPMARNSIFPVASMSKPFTTLAAMMLAEEGKIQLAYPVSRYLPEFKDLKVGVEKKDEATGKMELVLEPAKREMTVQDLMRHTSGLTYGVFGKSLVKDRYNAVGAYDFNNTNAEMVTKLSQVPLQYHPGTVWEYSMSTDVLGRIVEVVSGLELDAFVAERILKPLKLSDTGFWVEGEKRQARIAEQQADPATGKRPPTPEVTKRPRWMSGGGGMVSTAPDYARLCQMFLNGGTLDGVRLVSRKTIELMASNHLPPGIQYGPLVPIQFAGMTPMPEDGGGFGLGFGVRMESGRSPLPGSVGEYSWAGVYGTYFWIDPKEKIVAVLMLQAPALRMHYRYLMRHYVYQSIVD